MTMHPELEDAFSAGQSIPEVIKAFTKHHSGPIEERIDFDEDFFELRELNHTDCSFWDTWQPLFRRLTWIPSFGGPNPVGEPFLSIHKALTREIMSWLCDSKRRSNVYLIAEPQAPGLHDTKYTRADVFAKICHEAQRFGLPLRNERINGWHDVDSLTSELAAFYPPFRRMLARKLIDNPGIVELPPRTRFKKLIHEPWKALQESHPEYITSPPVVVLRWDSRLQDEELLSSICEFGSSQHPSLLLWIISIDIDVKLPMPDILNPFAPFRYLRLPVCYNEGPADAELLLLHHFSALRCKHKEIIDEDEVWPSEEQMSELSRIVSGAFESVEAIIQLIDWKDGGGPKAHLERFLAYMVYSPSPSDERPYCALDHFYTRTLSNTPPDLLSVTKSAFSIFLHYGIYGATFLDLGRLLSLGNGTFLPHVCRMVLIKADYDYYHSSWFRSFLGDPTRSGQFHIPRSESRHHVFQASLHILSHASNLTSILKPTVPWIQIDPTAYRNKVEGLRRITCIEFSYIGDTASESSWTLLRSFDFRCLAHTCDIIPLGNFRHFLRDLYELSKVHSANIVRVEPVNLLDRQFIGKCQGLAEPMALEERWFQSSCPEYVLLGFETETVLVVLAIRKGSGSDDGVNIYTSAMLDYM